MDLSEQDLGEVLDDLYSSPPAEFTRTRDAYARQARAEGNRDLSGRITALKKPPTAAWAVNLLVRERGEEVEQLLALGAAMREATASLAGAELRDLGVQQHKVLDAMRVQAVRLAADAGVRLSLDVGEQVLGTLRAAMGDAAAADAVRSGTLVRPLEPAGFGEVDVAGATADGAPPAPARAPAPPREKSPPPRDELRARREEKAARDAERQRAEAERRDRERRELTDAVEQARHALDEARDEQGAAAADLASARRRTDDLTRRQEDLQARLAAVTEQLESADAGLRTTERAAHAAGERVEAAERELERLTGRV